jgi:hypothetical protein
MGGEWEGESDGESEEEETKERRKQVWEKSKKRRGFFILQQWILPPSIFRMLWCQTAHSGLCRPGYFGAKRHIEDYAALGLQYILVLNYS